MLTRNRWEGRSGREMNLRATDLGYVLRTRTIDTILASGMYTPSGGILIPASSSRFRCRFSAFPPNSTTVFPLHISRSQQSGVWRQLFFPFSASTPSLCAVANFAAIGFRDRHLGNSKRQKAVENVVLDTVPIIQVYHLRNSRYLSRLNWWSLRVPLTSELAAFNQCPPCHSLDLIVGVDDSACPYRRRILNTRPRILALRCFTATAAPVIRPALNLCRPAKM